MDMYYNYVIIINIHIIYVHYIEFMQLKNYIIFIVSIILYASLIYYLIILNISFICMHYNYVILKTFKIYVHNLQTFC